MQEIFNRRTIRKYKQEKVGEKEIHAILKAGMNAPSAKNLRPYEFIVVRDKDMLNQLSLIKPASYMVKDCSFAIVALAKETTMFWQQDMGASVQNMLLMAEYYNIGSCWIGINEEQGDVIRNLLNIPQGLNIFTMIAFGKKDETKEPNNYFDTTKIHFEKYNN